MKLNTIFDIMKWIIGIAIAVVVAYLGYLAYMFDLIDLKLFITWVGAEALLLFFAWLWDKMKKPPPKAEELAKAIAEESQKLKEKEEANKKHTDLIYDEIVRLLGKSSDFEVQLEHSLSCPNPDRFPFTKELLSHLEAYNALGIVRNAKELCKTFNTELEKAINDTIKEFSELVEKLAEKERTEDRRFSLQRYDIVPHPRSFYSPDIVAWNIYSNAGKFQPYIIETIDGRFKIGNPTVAETDNRDELELFTKLVNEYSLANAEFFKAFHDRRQKALEKIKEFFDALREIKKKLESGHRLEGHCYLCLEH